MCNGPVLIWWMKYMIYTESEWDHTLYYFRNDCRILKQKNPSECSDISSSKKASTSASTMLAVTQWQMSFLWKDLNTRKQHAENIQMYGKNSWGFSKEATKRKQDQHILLKVQDTDLAAREARYHATCRRDYTREDDRHQETTKDTKTIEEKASNKTIYKLFSVHRSVCYGQNRLEIKRLAR